MKVCVIKNCTKVFASESFTYPTGCFVLILYTLRDHYDNNNDFQVIKKVFYVFKCSIDSKRNSPISARLLFILHKPCHFTEKMHDLVKRSVGFLYNKLMGNQSCTLGKIYSLIFSLFFFGEIVINIAG